MEDKGRPHKQAHATVTLAAVHHAYLTLYWMVLLNRTVSWGTMLMLCRSEACVRSATFCSNTALSQHPK